MLTKTNKEKAKHFANEILSRIGQMISEHNIKIRRLNTDIDKNHKVHKVMPARGDARLEDDFYQHTADTVEKLKILGTKLSESDGIKRQRRDLYLHKIDLTIACIQQISQTHSIKLTIDEALVKQSQQMNSMVEQIIKSINLMQKESFGCCFGGKKNTAHQVEKSLMDLIGYYQFWLQLPKCLPQVQREVQLKYQQLDYNQSIFFDIDKMIVHDWPQPEIIEVEKPVQRIIEKIVTKEPSKIVTIEPSFKEEAERRDLADKYERIQRQYSNEKLLREAHEMLIGLGRSQNSGKAVEIYKSIPEMNQSDAKQSLKSQTELRINPLICNILGCLYEQGKYVHKEMKKAVEYYIKSASVQDPEGLYKIGKFLQKNLVNSAELFDQQYPSRRDQIKDAIQHYERAAEKGHLDAITDLGHIYQNGIRVDVLRDGNSIVSDSEASSHQNSQFVIEPNLDHAVKYYQLAKKEQFPRALNNLGALLIKEREKLLETMKGSNLERGIKYLKKATDMMYPKAFLNLGKCFELGLGVKQNHERAKALYIQGAGLGDNQCKLQLVRFLINNQLKVEGKADMRIAQYLRQVIVSDPSNAEALFLMGMLYQKGIFVQPSPQHAFHYMSRSAKADYAPALVKMGDYYYSGYFTSKDISKCQHYYQKGVAKTDSNALINLGLLYSKGEIESANKAEQIQKARELFVEAAKLGNPNAFIYLNQQKNRQRSVIKQAAELGSQEALKILTRTGKNLESDVKTIQKTKAEYGMILNKLIKQATAKAKLNPKMTKRTELPPPLSQKQRQMMIYSPRSRADASSPNLSARFNSPQTFRETAASRQFYR